jgi:Zn-dependent protease with chaperone function
MSQIETSVPAFCGACGTANVDGGRFCTECGAPVDGSSDADSVLVGACAECGGNGSRLPEKQLYCPACRWLRPLAAGYAMDPGSFLWQLDADAMRMLHSMAPVRSAAQAISQRFGTPYLEATVNGVRLSEKQLPEIFRRAVFAARVVGLPYLPEIYISGEEMWSSKTLGSESRAFVALGSVLLNFKPADLLFLLGREMGHARAGHALWRTVLEFAAGRGQGNKTIMGEGVLQFLNPAKLLESAIEAPLMAWARHSEITADRAGLLVCGDVSVARRVLLQWTLKSFPIYSRLDMQAWREQEDRGDDPTVRLAQQTMTSVPYIAPRLKLLRAFELTSEFEAWRPVLDHYRARDIGQPPERNGVERPADRVGSDRIRLVCAACGKAMRVKREALERPGGARVRCPNPECGKVLNVKPKPGPPAESLTTD